MHLAAGRNESPTSISHMSRLARLALLAGIFLAQSAVAQLPVVYGEPALSTRAVAPRLRLSSAKIIGSRVDLPDISANAEASVLAANLRSRTSKAREQMRRMVIGVVRSTDSAGEAAPAGAQLRWAAVEGGFSGITLWVLTGNSAAISFYETQGFSRDGATRTEEISNGASPCEIRMARQLP